MSYVHELKNIQNGDISPLYLITGTESYLIEDIIQKITGRVLSLEEQEMNLLRFDLEETPVEAVVEEGMTFPFMGGAKVVIAKNASFLTGQKGKEKVEHRTDSLLQYVQNPPPETVMIITAPYEKLDERKKLVKNMKSSARTVSAAPMQEKDIRQWLDTKALELNTAMSDAAKEKLLTLVGGNLQMLTSEVNKLAMHADGERIEAESVALLVARSLEQDIFALVDHVVKAEAEGALRIYRDLLKQKESPLKILSLMVRQFRILYQVKHLASQGYGEKMMASRLKLHPFVVKLAVRQSKSFQPSFLLQQLDELAELDFHIKTGRVDESTGVELFLLKRGSRRGHSQVK
ncbi:DNA polymerase III subunit delta [Alkalicoccus chagannorensis]|uniref:DNA polymerase III subunit delta n=1 Tax=Alkalicoccus chagannorensis TaxID=427072 RepID=UPI00042A5448|nr:DNA polymerase III subunit delta [Alkalicoccus chagannorensis]